jgi:hypothetical protein
MRWTFTVLLFILIFPLLVAAQDSSLKKVKFTAGFETLARQHLYPPYRSTTLQPAVIRSYRNAITRLPINYDTVTDNPFRHGAMYMAIKTTTVYKNKIRLNADIYGEYRGFSYGTFNTNNNLVLYPVLSVQVNDTIRVGKESFLAEARIGQFLDEHLDEGIMIYNIDLQGTRVSLRHHNSRIGLTIYGDMSNAIGLEVDDLKALSYEYLFNNDSARIGASWVIAAPPGHRAKYHTYFNLFGRTTTRNGIGLYAEFSYNTFVKGIFEGLRSFHKMIGVVAGAEHTMEKKRLWLNNRIELRYYGATYNLLHHDFNFRYRDSANNDLEMYGNTVGEYLYPLRKFDTPFSQWAVFTEYIGHTMGAAAINGEFGYRIHPKLDWRLAYDLNAIWSRLDETFDAGPLKKRTSFFVYPFFKAAVSYTPLKECHFTMFITNKSMNLDLSYPTHYLNRRVFWGGELWIKI